MFWPEWFHNDVLVRVLLFGILCLSAGCLFFVINALSVALFFLSRVLYFRWLIISRR